ncbi:unnamed protein product [Moneuplotes crassus]|uniref:MaoC-like domain-containing protein n=1 Tax=Euplotes crassus TaxID=5936 RepID=A0AAD1XS17_EUPCR|nr:unnamed protein product [Moneuplotes crassus]
MEVDPTKARGYVISENNFQFTEALCKLYHLCIGFNQDPLDEDDFKFTYEYDDDFTTFPTICLLAMGCIHMKIFETPGLPALKPQQLLHGEQIVEVFNPIVPGSTIKCVATIEDVADKVKGMLFIVKIDILDPENPEMQYSRCYMNCYVKGYGGFGDKGVLGLRMPSPPIRTPDQTLEISTNEKLASLYRICGDLNPLHMIPSAAKSVGFDKPILHGLCTYGILSRAVYKTYCQEDPTLIKSVSARFCSHVFPGETIKIDLYKEANSVFFSASTKERGLVVCTGVVDLTPLAKI